MAQRSPRTPLRACGAGLQTVSQPPSKRAIGMLRLVYGWTCLEGFDPQQREWRALLGRLLGADLLRLERPSASRRTGPSRP